MGVGSGKSFSSVENPSAVLSLEISSFLMATHPEEDSIRTPPPHHQDVHICCGPGQGPFLSLRQASVLSFRFLFFFILMRRRIWTSWLFRIWSSSCSWWRCSLRRICNLFWWIYNFFCILNNQSCWFVCFVKPGDVCLGFHRSENRFGHVGVRPLSRRIIRHRDELSCLGVWNISFYFYCLNFFFLLWRIDSL